MFIESENNNYNPELVLRLLRGIYQYLKRADELEPIGIDLNTLAPIDEIVQAAYIAIGVPTDIADDEDLFTPNADGILWDWGGRIYDLYTETDGSDSELLNFANKMLEDYRVGLHDMDEDD